MKVLLKEFTPIAYFTNEATNKKIGNWVKKNLNMPELDLNEPHSCTVTTEVNHITVYGDEDFISMEVAPVVAEL